MTLVVSLLGRPAISRGPEPVYRFRSRKSWALLAYVLMAERPPTRARLASLLFDDAADPLGALRWNLAEVRRALGATASIEGDPVILELPPGTVVDVAVLARGTWLDAVELPHLGASLLEGVDVRGAAGFESWLLVEQERLAAASESVLHEAAQGLMAQGELSLALGYARRVAALSPLDENHQALLIRLLRLTGDDRGAEVHLATYSRALHDELGLEPGPAVLSASRGPLRPPHPVTGSVSIEAILESGAAAVAAGATDAGLASLRAAVGLADLAADARLQVRSRVILAETLVHSLRGMDEEGLAALYAADELGRAHAQPAWLAEIRVELGYVDFLRARYDRAERWLTDALNLAPDAVDIRAKASAYLASADSDRADYPRALARFAESIELAREAGDIRRQVYATSMIGRLHLLRGELDLAEETLRAAIELGERDRWLAFLPWPQAFLGELELARGRIETAASVLDQAFARACQLGDPCWEGVTARALALVAEARGDAEAAFELLTEARVRCNRLADPYVWLDAYILDATCTLGVRYGHPEASTWVESMQRLASRTSMREMTVRALVHGAMLGAPDAAAGARLLVTSVENPVVEQMVSGLAAAT